MSYSRTQISCSGVDNKYGLTRLSNQYKSDQGVFLGNFPIDTSFSGKYILSILFKASAIFK